MNPVPTRTPVPVPFPTPVPKPENIVLHKDNLDYGAIDKYFSKFTKK